MCWVFDAVLRLSVVAVIGDYFLAVVLGLILPWLLFWSPGARCEALQLQHMGLVAPWHVEPSQSRDQNGSPCISRQILNPWTPREALFSTSHLQPSPGSVKLLLTPTHVSLSAPPPLWSSRLLISPHLDSYLDACRTILLVSLRQSHPHNLFSSWQPEGSFQKDSVTNFWLKPCQVPFTAHHSDAFLLPSFTQKDTVPTQIIQENLPISRSLITPSKSVWLSKGNIFIGSGNQGKDVFVWKGCYSANHTWVDSCQPVDFLKLIFIGVQLLYNVVSFCCTAKWVRYPFTYTPLCWISFQLKPPRSIGQSSLFYTTNYTLVIYFIHSINRVYISIPISQFIPPPFHRGIHTFVFYICVFSCFADKIIYTIFLIALICINIYLIYLIFIFIFLT